MARRLVEKGVRFITINYGGWDTHKAHFPAMRRMLPEMDKGMGTLIRDLADHGLLDSTIVWWTGEFGRTPKVDWQPPWDGGRQPPRRLLLHAWSPAAVSAAGKWSGSRMLAASKSRIDRSIRGT